MEPYEAVVVTGMGVVSPVGCTLPDFWSGLVGGESVARTLDDPEYAELPGEAHPAPPHVHALPMRFVRDERVWRPCPTSR